MSENVSRRGKSNTRLKNTKDYEYGKDILVFMTSLKARVGGLVSTKLNRPDLVGDRSIEICVVLFDALCNYHDE